MSKKLIYRYGSFQRPELICIADGWIRDKEFQHIPPSLNCPKKGEIYIADGYVKDKGYIFEQFNEPGIINTWTEKHFVDISGLDQQIRESLYSGITREYVFPKTRGVLKFTRITDLLK